MLAMLVYGLLLRTTHVEQPGPAAGHAGNLLCSIISLSEIRNSGVPYCLGSVPRAPFAFKVLGV